jgi:hypothetical protein
VSNDKQPARHQGAPSVNTPVAEQATTAAADPVSTTRPVSAPSGKFVPLLLGRVRTLEQANNTWAVVVPAATPFTAVLDEKYWSNVAGMFKMFDRIVVNTDDGAYTATLHVRAAGRGWAKVAVIDHHELGAPIEVKESDTHTIAYRGAYAMWSVIRRADSEVIKEKFQTAEEARVWMAGHLRALAG